jgi:hypothetical protein
MTWKDVVGVAIGCCTLLGVAWKLINAWTSKAVAEAMAAKELSEIRTSHAKFMEWRDEVQRWMRDRDSRAAERRRILTAGKGVAINEDDTP